MKIYSFVTVKDESDIIESFVRYNMNILDGMIISDNDSSDNTLEILYKLKDEGYNIDILIDKNDAFDQYKRRNELLQYTIKKYNPDWILPLDADEFIACDEEVNPRKIIEQLDPGYLYLYKMENFVLTRQSSNKEKFIPNRITKIRKLSTKYNYFYKCIISKEIYSYKGGVKLAIGAHNLYYKDGSIINTKYLNRLYQAHYPVRSIEQYINKDITLAINGLRFNPRESGTSYHKYYIFDKLLNNGKISPVELYDFSKYYDLVDKKTATISDKNLVEGLVSKKLNTSFCKNIDIKYHFSGDSYELILKNTLKVSKAVIDSMRNEKYKDDIKINDSNLMIEELNNKIIDLNDVIMKQQDDYKKVVNSKWWKLRKIFLFWK